MYYAFAIFKAKSLDTLDLCLSKDAQDLVTSKKDRGCPVEVNNSVQPLLLTFYWTQECNLLSFSILPIKARK